VPYLCPEPLLPIGAKHGGTILGRLARQLGDLGFRVFATVAEPGYVYRWRPAWNAGYFGFRNDPATTTQSPWTEERIEQVSEFSVPITVPTPDMTNYHDSAFRALDEIGYVWGQCLVVQGDHLFTDALMRDVVALPFPCQLRPSRGGRAFSILLLTPGAAREYRRLGGPFRAANKHEWNGSGHSETGFSREGAEFALVAPIVYITDILPGHHQYEFSDDVDSPGSYRAALDWLRRQGAELEVGMPKFDKCIKTESERIIWMVRGKNKVAFKTWEEYEAAGRPPFEIVTQEELDGYKTVRYFRRHKRDDQSASHNPDH